MAFGCVEGFPNSHPHPHPHRRESDVSAVILGLPVAVNVELVNRKGVWGLESQEKGPRYCFTPIQIVISRILVHIAWRTPVRTFCSS